MTNEQAEQTTALIVQCVLEPLGGHDEKLFVSPPALLVVDILLMVLVLLHLQLHVLLDTDWDYFLLLVLPYTQSQLFLQQALELTELVVYPNYYY